MSPESGKFSSKHSEAAKRGWQMDEDKKKARVAAIHNETWTKRVRESWDRLSAEEREHRSIELSGVGREALKKACRERMVACLGEDPKQTLQDFIKNGLSASEIAIQVQKKPTTMRTWLKKEGVHAHKTTTLRRQTIQERQDLVNQGRERDLIKHLIPDDFLVIDMRYNKDGNITPLDMIREKLGDVSRERVRQRESRGLGTLKELLSGELVLKNGSVLQ